MNVQATRLLLALSLTGGLATAALAGPTTTVVTTTQTVPTTTQTTTLPTTTQTVPTTTQTTTVPTTTTIPSGHKVEVCHKGKTLSVDDTSLRAHLKHGDTVGVCP